MAHADDRDSAFRGALLDVIVETAPDAIITIGADGLILSFSAAAERLFGYTEAEVVGQNVRCLMPQPFHDQHDQYLQRYLKTGEQRVIGIGREVRAQRKNGEIFVAELAVGEFFEGDARIFAGFLHDITDRVEAQRKAERLQRMLDRVSDGRDRQADARSDRPRSARLPAREHQRNRAGSHSTQPYRRTV